MKTLKYFNGKDIHELVQGKDFDIISIGTDGLIQLITDNNINIKIRSNYYTVTDESYKDVTADEMASYGFGA